MEGDNKPVPVNRQNFLAVHPAGWRPGLRGAAAGTRCALHAADTVACTAVLRGRLGLLDRLCASCLT